MHQKSLQEETMEHDNRLKEQDLSRDQIYNV